jgi:SAM-dependent methyltransferase
VKPYQDYTYGSKFFLKRWLHKHRYQKAVHLLDIKSSDTLLDYGCGDGYFLQLCRQKTRTAQLFGFEPVKSLRAQGVSRFSRAGVRIVQHIGDLEKDVFTKITCLDVCEHLTINDLNSLLSRIATLLAPDGTAFISVPLEVGVPALVKNAYRFLRKYPVYRLTLEQYVKSGLGLPMEREHAGTLDNEPYIYAHKGFDYRRFEKMLRSHLQIEKRYYSPVDSLGVWLNNTVLYQCVKKDENV